jgi:Spy/CpxP family protein refolding chaperone
MSIALTLRNLCLIALIVGKTTLAREADSTTPATQPDEQRAVPPGELTTLIDRLREQLSTMKLSDDQQQKIDAAISKAEQSLKLLDQELQNATQSQRADRIRQIFNDLRDQIRSVLSPEQQEQLRTIIKTSAAGRLQRLREGLAQLDLTSEQKQKLDSLLKQAREQMEEARKSVGSAGQDSVEKIRASGAEVREKLAEILTDEQRLQLRDFIENHSEPTTQPQPAK